MSDSGRPVPLVVFRVPVGAAGEPLPHVGQVKDLGSQRFVWITLSRARVFNALRSYHIWLRQSNSVLGGYLYS